MRGDQDLLARVNARSDGFVPIGKETIDGILEAFREGKFRFRQGGITRVVARVAIIGFFKC